MNERSRCIPVPALQLLCLYTVGLGSGHPPVKLNETLALDALVVHPALDPPELGDQPVLISQALHGSYTKTGELISALSLHTEKD